MAAGSLADALTGKNLDTAVSTVNTNVSTRLGGIAGVDRGTINITDIEGGVDTATVSAVVTARSLLSHLGVSHGAGSTGLENEYAIRIDLTNTTTITATRTAAGGSVSPTVSFELVEYSA
jgi:hypothetical protein